MVRPNTLLAVGNDIRNVVYDYAKDVTLHLVQLEDGGVAECTVYTANGSADLTAEATRTGNTVTIQTKGHKPFTVLLRNLSEAASVSGASVVSTPKGLQLTPHVLSGTITVQLK